MTEEVLGRVAALWRYPVKSMRGESVAESEVTATGLRGDRGWAIVDPGMGKPASAKVPAWAGLFGLRARLERGEGPEGPAVRVEFPDGGSAMAGAGDCDRRLSGALGRPCRLARSGFPKSPPFVDLAPVHLLTTASLSRLESLAPGSRFDPRRFRPNVIVESVGAPGPGFPEDSWVGGLVEIGTVRLRVTRPCSRCVMTTLPQEDLPKDPEVLKAAVRHNGRNVGVYAEVERPGLVRVGDPISVRE